MPLSLLIYIRDLYMTIETVRLNDDDIGAIKALAQEGQVIDLDLESLLIDSLE